ncbi:MAG: hypothetical protein NDJ94_13910 [Vicinamibacteria bacterium]|nr:hypothetical protein [Vicinamibacteria bacterium]
MARLVAPRPWSVARLVVAALLWCGFVWAYVAEATSRDPRSLVLLLPLSAVFAYVALSALLQATGREVTRSWRALFVLLAAFAWLPSWDLAEGLARARERASLESSLQPVLAELAARQARAGRAPIELEEILRQRLPNLPEQPWRLRQLAYEFDEGQWALHVGCVPMDRDDEATLTFASDGRRLRHDTGADGGHEAARAALLAELPFLERARRCECELPYREVDTRWRCLPPCGTWAVPPVLPTGAAPVEPPPGASTPSAPPGR